MEWGSRWLDFKIIAATTLAQRRLLLMAIALHVASVLSTIIFPWRALAQGPPELLHVSLPRTHADGFRNKGSTAFQVKNIPLRFNIHSLRKQFIVTVNGERYIAQPGSGYRRGFERRVLSGKDHRIARGSLFRVGAARAGDTTYGSYLFTVVSNPRKRRSAFGGAIVLPNGTRLSVTGKEKGGKRRAILHRADGTLAQSLQCEAIGDAPAVKAIPRAESAKGNISIQSDPVIHLLVAYTRSALVKMGNSPEAVASVIDFEMDRANQASIDTGLGFSYELAGDPLFLDEPYPAEVQDQFFALIQHGEKAQFAESIFDEIEARHADLVNVLTDPAGSKIGGAGYLLPSLDPVLGSRFSFAISGINYLMYSESHEFNHENGHMLGADHDPPNTSSCGLLGDSCGHTFTGLNGHSYATIMAYSLHGEESLHQYSDPTRTYQGVATGVTGQSDNARLLRLSGPEASNFHNYNYLAHATGSINAELLRNADDADVRIRFHFSQSDAQNFLTFYHLNILKVETSSDITVAEYTFTTDTIERQLPAGQYYVVLDPDRYIKTENFTVPSTSDIQLNVSLSGSTLLGTARFSDGSAVTIPGSWITIYSQKIVNGTLEDDEALGTVSVDANGNFSYPLTQAGFFRATQADGVSHHGSSAVYFVPAATPTPTATPVPTASPVPTATSTPEASVAPTPAITRRVSVKLATTRLTVVVRGTLSANAKAVKGERMQLVCGGIVKGTKTTNRTGKFSLRIKRQRKKALRCYVRDSHGSRSKNLTIKALARR